jgi:hypothetical protein
MLICIPALITSDPIIRVGYTLLSLTSVLHHAKYKGNYCGKQWVDIGDEVLAHVLVMYTTYLALTMKQSALTIVYWTSLVYLVYVYYFVRPCEMPSKKGDLVHSSLHIAGVIGLSCLIIARKA